MWRDAVRPRRLAVRVCQVSLPKGRVRARHVLSLSCSLAEVSNSASVLVRLTRRTQSKPRLDQTDDLTYRQRDAAIGSGTVESAGKQTAVRRAKGPGMPWTAEGLEMVLTLWSNCLNGDLDDYWTTDPQRTTG